MYPLLTQSESFYLECEDSDLSLIHLADRGGLKYPSNEVLNAVITLWKVLFHIEQNSLLMKELSTLSSRTILIQLSTTRLIALYFGDLSVLIVKLDSYGTSIEYSLQAPIAF